MFTLYVLLCKVSVRLKEYRSRYLAPCLPILNLTRLSQKALRLQRQTQNYGVLACDRRPLYQYLKKVRLPQFIEEKKLVINTRSMCSQEDFFQVLRGCNAGCQHKAVVCKHGCFVLFRMQCQIQNSKALFTRGFSENHGAYLRQTFRPRGSDTVRQHHLRFAWVWTKLKKQGLSFMCFFFLFSRT